MDRSLGVINETQIMIEKVEHFVMIQLRFGLTQNALFGRAIEIPNTSPWKVLSLDYIPCVAGAFKG
jgi:hypothetical protein